MAGLRRGFRVREPTEEPGSDCPSQGLHRKGVRRTLMFPSVTVQLKHGPLGKTVSGYLATTPKKMAAAPDASARLAQ